MNPCMQGDPEIELMLRVRDGDAHAFDDLACRYRPALTRFFYSMCWNADVAKDYAQEVLVRVWLARERYVPSAKLSTYIFRIARNYWLTVLRNRKCHPEAMSLEDAWQPMVDQQDLEKTLICRYESARIRSAIANLPEHYRAVFVLSHFQDMKYAEIAEVLEIPPGTVKSRMSTAVRLLREAIGREGLLTPKGECDHEMRGNPR